MSEHTPGPWIARGDSVVAQRNIAASPKSTNEESVFSLTRDFVERLANARLASAAPDMGEFLKALDDFIDLASNLASTNPVASDLVKNQKKLKEILIKAGLK